MAITKPQAAEPHRPQWRTRSGFLLAAIGSAVGLGNIWRFSYLCYENGGGAFLVPYLLALVMVGIPLLIAEYAVGHRLRGATPTALATINPRWEWLGWWMVIFVMFGIALYYCVIIAWCVCYMGFSVTLAWGSNPNDFFFHQFLGMTEGPHVIGNVRTPILFALLVVWLINWIVVFFGVEKGIERANKLFVPMLIILLLFLVIWTAQLPGAEIGLARYLTPDFARLGDAKVWVDAFSQAFFSLSLGFGIMIAYASYLPRKTDINVNACITGVADTLIALIAGLAVFSTLGYMTAQTGKPFTEVVQAGIGLAFVAYPQAISLLPHGKEAFGLLFFLALTVAGLSSSVSILEAFTSAVIDKFNYQRKTVATVLSVVGFLGGLIFVTGSGLAWLDIVDHFLSNYGLMTACLLECVVLAWFYGAQRIREHANGMSGFQVNRIFDLLMRYIVPAIIIILLVNSLMMDLKAPYEGYSWLALVLIGRDWLLVTLIAALIVAMRPWRRPLK